MQPSTRSDLTDTEVINHRQWHS